MSDEEKQKAIRDFAFTKGISVALLAGMMSACFSLGLEAGAEVQQTALALGASDLFALNPVILLVTLGGFAPMRRIACGRISRIVPAGSISRYRYRQESITYCFALWRVCFGILNSSGWAWEKFLHRFAGHAGFLVEHIDVAECYFQQRVGNFVERVEWGRTADRNRIDRWVADSYLLDGFPKFGKQ